MPRFTLSLAAALTLCAGIAAAEPSNYGGYANTDPSDRQYVGLSRQQTYGQTRQTDSWAQSGARFGQARAQGSRANVTQTGPNNGAPIRQRGNNKRATVIQRGNDTDVTIDQHGEGPGGALVVTW